jgi:hypothetical protein
VHGTFKDPAPGVHAGPLILRGGGAVALAVFAAPVAALAALVVPESGKADATQCKPLLDDLRRTPPKAPAAGKASPAGKAPVAGKARG